MDDPFHRPPPAPDVADTQWDSVETRDVVEYSSETDTYRASFDGTTASVSTAIVSTVAAVSETHPMELPPLYSACNVDELAALIEPTVTGSSNDDTRVSFTFNGYYVTVYAYGVVEIQPQEDSSV